MDNPLKPPRFLTQWLQWGTHYTIRMVLDLFWTSKPCKSLQKAPKQNSPLILGSIFLLSQSLSQSFDSVTKSWRVKMGWTLWQCQKDFMTLSKIPLWQCRKGAYTLLFDVISSALNIVFIANIKKEFVRYLALCIRNNIRIWQHTYMNLRIYKKRRKCM